MRQYLASIGATGTQADSGPATIPILDSLFSQPAQAVAGLQAPQPDPSAAPFAPTTIPDASNAVGGHNLRPRQRARASSVPPPATEPISATADADDATNVDGPNAPQRQRMFAGWPFLGVPGQGLPGMQEIPGLPGIQAMPGLPGMPNLPGMTFGPFPFAGIPMGLGMDVERPPDTRRAKELLRGLNVVPRGLVRRMERVEKMLGQEGAETGKLVCAVCYDPLLGDLPANDEKDVVMKDASANLKSAEESKSEEEDPKAKTRKPKHPSLEPHALVALPCTHVFHAVDCLLPWFEQGKTTCPTCRFDIDPKSETLNLARWLGRRRRAPVNPPATADPSMENVEGAQPAPPVAAATAQTDGDTRMDGEDEDEVDAVDGTDAIDEGGDSDSTDLLRETIRRALVGVLGQALLQPMGQMPWDDEQQVPNPSTNPDPLANNAQTAPLDPWDLPPNQMMLDMFGSDGSLDPLGRVHVPFPGTNIELPSANRDQDGRMLRGDGESSVAATANSSPRTVANTELPQVTISAPASPQVRAYPNTRGRREHAPSPELQQAPSTSSRPAETTQTSRSSWSIFDGFFRRDRSAQEPPVAGPSNSGPATSPPSAASSRPPTPRHHPYANARPATNTRSTSTLGVPTPGPSEGATTLSFGSEVNNRNGRMSITRHSITFNLAMPLASFINMPGIVPTAAPNTENDNANGALPQQQPADPAPPRFPDFFNGMLFGMGSFGNTPGGPGDPAAGAAPGGVGTGRTERNRAPRKKWVAPEGTTLRSVIESKERQVGLRCDDVSCLWGPEDEDELDADIKFRADRTYLHKALNDNEASCGHRFHPECLLVSSRIADAGLDREMNNPGSGEWLEVGCPFCRVHGGLEKREWRMHREFADSV